MDLFDAVDVVVAVVDVVVAVDAVVADVAISVDCVYYHCVSWPVAEVQAVLFQHRMNLMHRSVMKVIVKIEMSVK